jgi:hypothetical protein
VTALSNCALPTVLRVTALGNNSERRAARPANWCGRWAEGVAMSEIDHMVPPREPLSPPKAASAAGVTEEFDNTRARVLAALLDAHHTTFYTVISVIQATCFGFLVLVCFEEGTHFGVSPMATRGEHAGDHHPGLERVR